MTPANKMPALHATAQQDKDKPAQQIILAMEHKPAQQETGQTAQHSITTATQTAMAHQTPAKKNALIATA